VQQVILASVYAGPDAEYQLNTLSDGDAIDAIPGTSSIIVIACKKRSFQSKMHQKPSGSRWGSLSAPQTP